MTKIPIPESIIEFRVDRIGCESDVIFAYEVSRLDEGHYKAIITEQAEAYANARVREALESVESTLESMQTAALKQRVPEDEDEGGWNGDCIARAFAISQAILEIRALLPSTPARPESEQ